MSTIWTLDTIENKHDIHKGKGLHGKNLQILERA